MVALLLIMLLLTAGVVAIVKRSDPSSERDLAARQRTLANLDKIEAALVAFAMQNRRLPCPAYGKGVSEPDWGLERHRELRKANVPVDAVCSVDGKPNYNSAEGTQVQTDGVIPWRSLGLPRADALDGWGNLFTYRVSPELVKPSSMNLSGCHPSGTASVDPASLLCRSSCTGSDLSGCTSPGTYTSGKGLKVAGAAGLTLMDPVANTGAAYVVISHGDNRAGAYSASGTVQTGQPPASAVEAPNTATFRFQKNDYPVFRDSTPSYAIDGSYFDDIVLRPRIIDVANAARLGPRSR